MADLTIDAKPLAAALALAARVTEARNTIPILAMVRLVATGDTIELTTSDLDCELRQVVPMARGAELACCVDSRRFAALAAACAAGSQIGLTHSGGRLTITSGRGRWVLPTLPVTDFPALPFDPPRDPVTLPAAGLASDLARIDWSIGNQPARPYLGGVFLNAEAGKLRLTSCGGTGATLTDGVVDWPGDAEEVILPAKLVRLIGQACGEARGESTAELEWDAGKARLRIGALTLTGKLIDQAYPQYRRTIPPLQADPVRFDPARLREALRRVALVETGRDRMIRIERGENCLAVQLTGADGSTGREEVPAECAEGPPCGFNALFLGPLLEAVGGETVEWHQADPGTPGLFRRAVGDGCMAWLMPVRI